MRADRRRWLFAGGAAASLAGVAALWRDDGPREAGRRALLPQNARADRLEVRKAARLLLLGRDGVEIARHPIALGFEPTGHKRREGDGRTPEGRYRIDRRNPNSRFHLSLGISYPNASDRAAAHAAGVSPGGDIFIHGLPNGFGAVGASHRLRDWTAGCIAVTNAEIEEIWARTPIGTPIDLFA